MRILSLVTFCLIAFTGSAAWALQQAQPQSGESLSDSWFHGTLCPDRSPEPLYQPNVEHTYATFGSTLTIQTSFSDEIIASTNDPALN